MALSLLSIISPIIISEMPFIDNGASQDLHVDMKIDAYFFNPGRSQPPAPTSLGSQNRYFSKGFRIKDDAFIIPAALSRLPPQATALKIDTFEKDFK